jgi:hypothetical protein
MKPQARRLAAFAETIGEKHLTGKVTPYSNILMLTQLPDHRQQLSDSGCQALRQWLTEFDQSWNEHRLAAFVRDLPSPDASLRRPALLEMVKIDLKRNWEQGRRKNVESYLITYPELGTPDTAPAAL